MAALLACYALVGVGVMAWMTRNMSRDFAPIEVWAGFTLLVVIWPAALLYRLALTLEGKD